MEPDALFKILIATGSITYSVVFGIVAKKVWDVPKLVDEKLNKIMADTKMAHDRLNVHDRISSKIIGEDFDSRVILESGMYPRHHV